MKWSEPCRQPSSARSGDLGLNRFGPIGRPEGRRSGVPRRRCLQDASIAASMVNSAAICLGHDTRHRTPFLAADPIRARLTRRLGRRVARLHPRQFCWALPVCRHRACVRLRLVAICHACDATFPLCKRARAVDRGCEPFVAGHGAVVCRVSRFALSGWLHARFAPACAGQRRKSRSVVPQLSMPSTESGTGI
jgi:hypothetical protein